MTDWSKVPLSIEERRVFGENAVRDPVTGVPVEQGIRWPASSLEALAEASARSAPTAALSDPAPEPRTLDRRQVHPVHETPQ